MNFLDLLRLILDNLSRRKGRVVMTAVGVVIGTASVVLLISLANGMQQNYQKQFGNMGDLTMIAVMPGYGQGPVMVDKMGGGGGGSQQQQAKLLTPSAIEEIKALPGVTNIIPREYLWGGAQIQFGRLETYGSVIGVGADDLSIFSYPAAQGDTTLSKGTVVIGGWVAKSFIDPRPQPNQEITPVAPDLYDQRIRLTLVKMSPDGQEIRKRVDLRVTGILTETRNYDADGNLFVPIEELTAWNEWFRGSRINRNRDGYETVYVKCATTDVVSEISDQINEMGYMASTPQAFIEGVNSFFTVMQVIFGGVGAIALLVAAIGIANTMTMAILERTREIGLMKAVGATNRDVLSIFLGEAAGIGLLGGLGGVLVGWLGGKALNVAALVYLAERASQSGGIPSSIAVATPAWLPVFSLIFATMIGLLSGLYPALRAATLQPVTALKYE